MNILPLSTQPVMVRHWVDIHSKTKSSLLLPTKGAEGVINVCSNQFGKSGLPETWIPLDKMYGTCCSCFFTFENKSPTTSDV